MEDNFECEVNGEWISTKGICINTNVKHCICNNEQTLFTMLIDATSDIANELEYRYLQGEEYAKINIDPFASLDNRSIEVADELAIKYIFEDSKNSNEYDDRIKSVIDTIDNMETIQKNTIEDLSKSVYLSQSRLSQLFRSEVGVSLASYLVLYKMRKAFEYVLEGENITEAAIHAGFNSSSHLAATCKRLFGIRFSDFIR